MVPCQTLYHQSAGSQIFHNSLRCAVTTNDWSIEKAQWELSFRSLQSWSILQSGFDSGRGFGGRVDVRGTSLACINNIISYITRPFTLLGQVNGNILCWQSGRWRWVESFPSSLFSRLIKRINGLSKHRPNPVGYFKRHNKPLRVMSKYSIADDLLRENIPSEIPFAIIFFHRNRKQRTPQNKRPSYQFNAEITLPFAKPLTTTNIESQAKHSYRRLKR